MKINEKLLVHFILISSVFLIVSTQYHNRNQRKRQNDKPAEQGRTLGLIQPLLNLGLSSIARPFIGYDAASPYRPTATSGSAQSDLHNGNYGYGNYGAYAPNYYTGHNYYGGHPLYRPFYPGYSLPFFGAYRPQIYPGNYAGQPQYSGYAGQRPRPTQQPAAYPSIGSASQTASATTNPAGNSAQAAQIANLLGQLLGQQLRPLLNQGGVSPPRDEGNYLENKRFRSRYYQG